MVNTIELTISWTLHKNTEQKKLRRDTISLLYSKYVKPT